jgi:hypothetical protein
VEAHWYKHLVQLYLKMPGLVHKLVVLAAVDGIVLQPLGHRNQGLPSPILIEYKTRRLTSLKQVASVEQEGVHSFEAHGIVGMLAFAAPDSV